MKAEEQIKALENENALLKGKLQLAESMFRSLPNFKAYKTETEVMTTRYREFNKKQDQKSENNEMYIVMKSKEEIETYLKEIESDERLGYPTATIEENAPLALIQLGLETRVATLKWVLGD